MLEEFRDTGKELRLVLEYFTETEFCTCISTALNEGEHIPADQLRYLQSAINRFVEAAERVVLEVSAKEQSSEIKRKQLSELQPSLSELLERLKGYAYVQSQVASPAQARSPQSSDSELLRSSPIVRPKVRRESTSTSSSQSSLSEMLPPVPLGTPIKVACAHKLHRELSSIGRCISSLLIRIEAKPKDSIKQQYLEEILNKSRRCAALISVYSLVRFWRTNSGEISSKAQSLYTKVDSLADALRGQLGCTLSQSDMATLSAIEASATPGEEKALLENVINASEKGEFSAARAHAEKLSNPSIKETVLKLIEDGERKQAGVALLISQLQSLLPSLDVVAKSIARTDAGGEVKGLAPALTEILINVNTVLPKALTLVESFASTGADGEVKGLAPELTRSLPVLRESLSELSILIKGINDTSQHGGGVPGLVRKLEGVIGDAGSSLQAFHAQSMGLLYNLCDAVGIDVDVEGTRGTLRILYDAVCSAPNARANGKGDAAASRKIRTAYNGLQKFKSALPMIAATISGKEWFVLSCKEVLKNRGKSVAELSDEEIVNASFLHDYFGLFGENSRGNEISTLGSVSRLMKLLDSGDCTAEELDQVVRSACEEIIAFTRSTAVLKERYFNRMSHLVDGARDASVGAGTLLGRLRTIVSAKNLCRIFVLAGFLCAASSCAGMSEFKDFKPNGIAAFVSLCIAIAFLGFAFSRVQGVASCENKKESEDKYSIYHGVLCILLPALAFGAAVVTALLRLFGDSIIKVKDLWKRGSNESLFIGAGIVAACLFAVILNLVDCVRNSAQNTLQDDSVSPPRPKIDPVFTEGVLRGQGHSV